MQELEQDFGPDIITLEDEDGIEHEFEIIDAVDIKDKQYVAVVPFVEESDESAPAFELLIMRVSEEDGEDFFDIVDGEEFDELADIFSERLSDCYDIETIDDD